MKQCCHCREWKDLSEFHRAKNRPDGLYPACRTCRKATYEANKERNRTYARRYYAEHREEEQRKARERNKSEAGRHRTWLYNEARMGRFPEGETPELLRQREWWLEYRRKARERMRQQQLEWREQNREHSNEYHREWKRRRASTHPQYWIAHRYARKARKLGNGGHFTVAEWEALKARYRFTCLCCGKSEPDIKLVPDHVIPLARGGRNDIGNLQPLCSGCNNRKYDKTIDYRPAV